MKKYYFIVFILGVITFLPNLYAEDLDEDKVEKARILAKMPITLEEFSQPSQEGTDEKKHWLTLDEFPFEYKGKTQNFCMANSFDVRRGWGEIAVYPRKVTETKIRLIYPGSFDDFGEPYLSNLKYQYISGKDDRIPHFIIEKVEVGYGFERKGYSQVCLSYFLDIFVSDRTEVTHVFSDLRSSITQAYFPKYGFNIGALEEYSFQRGMTNPYFWIKKSSE